MQLAVDVRIPEIFGGVEGEAIFIGIVKCSAVDEICLLKLFILLAGILNFLFSLDTEGDR